MPKFLFIAANEWPNWGGSELLWSKTAETLARAGNQVRVSVPSFDKPLAEVARLKSVGCQIFYRRPPTFFSRLTRRILPIPEYTHSHVRSAANGVDLVVISQGANWDGLPWMEATRAAGKRYVVIAQGAAEHFWPEDSVSKRLAGAHERATCAYFVSQSTLDLSRRQFAIPMPNAKVIRNPFNVPYEAHPPWPVNSHELTVACVGRLETGTKGQDLLLDVMNLPRWRERSIRISFVGKGLNERALRRMAEDFRLPNIEFAGHQGDIQEVWSKHHALALPSRHEGMPLTVVEAMLCGRPCIATDVGGNRELIRDGVNGFLAKAPTVELLDEAMNRAWENRNRLREMGEIAAADVRKWVSPDPAEDFARELAALAEKVRS